MKVLGITISSTLSLTEHVKMPSARVPAHCTPLKSWDTALQEVYKSVVVGKLLYAAPVWWGFASAADRQRVEAVLRRRKHSGLYSSRQTASEIIDSADDKLYCIWSSHIRGNHHVLHELLTDRVDISYNLRSRAHSRALPEKKWHLADKNFIVRMLYKCSY